MKEKLKKIAIFGVLLAMFCASTLAVHLYSYKLYLFFENNGLFKNEIEITLAEDGELSEYTLDELENNGKVAFDQSLMLVNTEYLLAEDFIPQVSEYKDTTVYMNNCMLSSYASLSAAVTENTGKKLYVSSDLRGREEQEALYFEDPFTATLPGASEHQTGLALDVYVARYSGDGFIKSKAGRFVNSECWRYGFIIRYPSFAEDVTGIRFEPWHIRYVGHPHADIIYNNHLTLEEYIFSMEIGEWYEAGGYLICRQTLGEQGTLTLPTCLDSCVISPDNTGAYIVTVRK
jgi:D-alanyl-D-alanine carboxypeptidase